LVTASPELCSAAVMEAKKWQLEKKSGLDSNSDLGYGSHSLNLIALPHVSDSLSLSLSLSEFMWKYIVMFPLFLLHVVYILGI
jgi:hypothetical protein